MPSYVLAHTPYSLIEVQLVLVSKSGVCFLDHHLLTNRDLGEAPRNDSIPLPTSYKAVSTAGHDQSGDFYDDAGPLTYRTLICMQSTERVLIFGKLSPRSPV